MTAFLFRDDLASLAEFGTGRRERLPYNFFPQHNRAFQFCRRKTAGAATMAITTARNFAAPSTFPTPDRIQFVRAPYRFPHASHWTNRTRHIPPVRSQSPRPALPLALP